MGHKRDQEGRVIRAKSHLVAQGFTQTFGVDYYKTYSPVVHLASLWSICALAVRNNWPIHQMDMDNAYLNASLQEPIYMKQPDGYFQGTNQHVLLLKKCLYGLKQSGYEWYKCLSTALSTIGFQKSYSDAAVFFRHGEKGQAIIGTAVDDLTITAPNLSIIQGIKDNLNKIFKMKEFREIHWLLNPKTDRDFSDKTISISQETYIDKIVKKLIYKMQKLLHTS